MEINHILTNLKRPKALIRAARMAVLANCDAASKPGRATCLENLLAREKDLEEDRRLGQAGYRAQDHVRVMAAILQEALRQRQVKV